MKPEAADYLVKARTCLHRARTIAAAGVPDVAAREAYLAAFHAAEAVIFEHAGRAAKTHRGVRSQFARPAQDDSRIAREQIAFLREGYEFKTTADYGIGYAEETISAADADAAIAMAARFIDRIAEILA